MKPLFVLLLAGTLAHAQSETPAFEVATIKPSPPPDGKGMIVGCKGGPGTVDPGFFRCTNATILMLILRGYDLKHYQVTGPDFVRETNFEINAKIPPGATKEQFQKMIQNLLAERFKIEFHWSKKEVPLYDLVVGKSGPKLAAHVDAKAPDPSAPNQKWGTDDDGYPVIPKDCRGCMMINAKGKARYYSSDTTMKDLADTLSNQLGKPVNDLTGLTGKYDITLSWSSGGGVSTRAEADGAPSDPGITIEGAVQQQLGLKLEARKGSIDTLIVDKAEKTPVEN